MKKILFIALIFFHHYALWSCEQQASWIVQAPGGPADTQHITEEQNSSPNSNFECSLQKNSSDTELQTPLLSKGTPPPSLLSTLFGCCVTKQKSC